VVEISIRAGKEWRTFSEKLVSEATHGPDINSRVIEELRVLELLFKVRI